jgi:RHS repeat-associated protein
MGRTTTVPAVDTYDTNSSPTSLAMTYYADDMVHTEAQDGITDSFTLDPAQRILGETNSSTGVTATNIYSDGSDSPAWTSNSNGSWSRDISDLSGNLAEIHTSSDNGTPTLELTNLHGDVVATAPDNTTNGGYANYNESTEFGVPRAATGPSGAEYGWLGGKQRSSASLGGTVLMGSRAYNPTSGRFLTVDPVPGGSSNNYDYCDQDPINRVDLGGTSSWREFGPRETIAWKFFRKNGFTRRMAAAMLGDLAQENGFHPSTSGPPYGLAQWGSPRWGPLTQWAHHYYPGVPLGNYHLQLEMVLHDVKTYREGPAPAWAAFKSAGSIKAAVDALDADWEQCGDTCNANGSLGGPGRYGYARHAAHHYHS